MIVIDASVLANALADGGGSGEMARARLAGDSNLHAPHLLDAEVLSVLRGRALGGHLDEHQAREAIAQVQALPVVRYPQFPLADRVWELRRNLTAYDGCYVALAEALRCPLVTADVRLSAAPGLRCEVNLIES